MPMTALTVPVLNIMAAAKEFESASGESQQLLERLEKVADGLKPGWAGAGRDAFFQHHTEWQALMRGQVAMLISLSQQPHALASRFERVDG